MNNSPKRTKILLAVLGVLVLVMVYMQMSGGDSSSQTPSATPTTVVKKTAPNTTSQQPSNGSTSDLPADPTSPIRPGASSADQITPPGGFPNTEPPVIVYNPYIQPKTTP